jgi:hypothetical protein
MPQAGLRWRLQIQLVEGRARYAVFLDFQHRETIEAQLTQLGRAGSGEFGVLYEFRNEFGEVLAFVSSAYREHEIRQLDAANGAAPVG